MYFNLTVPGFNLYTNASREGQHRGGVVMLVKSKLARYVTQVDATEEGQIWVVLSWLPKVKLGGVYIPPIDSPFYHLVQHGVLARQTAETGNVVVLGDLNARVGTPSIIDDNGNNYQYQDVKDHIVNEHGRTLLNMCVNNKLVVANHLYRNGKLFGGGLSFKRRNTWISEIDLCIVKGTCVDMISKVDIDHDIPGSDHAPLCVVLSVASGVAVSPDELLQRASLLGKQEYRPGTQPKMTKSVPHGYVDRERFITALQTVPPPVVTENGDAAAVEAAVVEGCRLITEAAASSTTRQRYSNMEHAWDVSQPRWKRLLDTNDTKLIWKSINWKGDIEENDYDKPNENQFKEHFENLLNPETIRCDESDISNVPYIPLLDDPFTSEELMQATESVNINKSYCGLCPGIIRMLPVSWFVFFLTLFNVIFSGAVYPQKWCCSKLTILFKSGSRMLCGNYRGISIMDTLAKIFDIMILNRLKMWFSIDNCQAGAQKGRGCLEQILSLRMLCDYAVHRKKKLYVLFIDFSKAYDRVPRDKLIQRLKDLGCGHVMLQVIKAMYTCTKNMIRSVIIDAAIGVRQGAPSSCLLFIIYIDQLVRMMKRAVETDGFLGSLHVMLLMDDAVVLATSREMCLRKFKVVCEFCNESGMLINKKKTKFFVINGQQDDKQCFSSDGITVEYAAQYLYLGAWFDDSASMKMVLKLHETASEAIVNKFAIFCASNTLMPFVFKKKVFDAAVTSALLYGSESWLTNQVKTIEKQYNKLIKCLLGVRRNTSVNLCMLEAGIVPLQSVLSERRKKFIVSQFHDNNSERPLHYVYGICREENTPGFRFLESSRMGNGGASSLETIKRSVLEKAPGATKITTYVNEMNPLMKVHPVYKTNTYIPDYKRQSFTRLRLMSHQLKVEVGRWSRTPAEQRVCHCDGTSIQTEKHVLLDCPLSEQCRRDNTMLVFDSMQDLFNENTDLPKLCHYVYTVMNVY